MVRFVWKGILRLWIKLANPLVWEGAQRSLFAAAGTLQVRRFAMVLTSAKGL
jgi:hypothetical protein